MDQKTAQLFAKALLQLESHLLEQIEARQNGFEIDQSEPLVLTSLIDEDVQMSLRVIAEGG